MLRKLDSLLSPS
ncbi:hypothetical protein F383_27171 [Gossypium arboreum]|uniref:Uncharacterized protein n=1 Tax=Gossypium arboreum TaxID=29729 RepID=A0A0B0MUC1_GOSAR|nr:hypothetical protein F383_27171 [Gossypium arboreum]